MHAIDGYMDRAMKKNYILFALLTLLSVLLAACATSTDPSEAYRDETQQQIYTRGKEALQDKGFAEAIKRFEALDVQYPYGPQTEICSILHHLCLLHERRVYDGGSAAADRFIRLHPTNPNVDYAYFMRGMSNFYQNLGLIERLFTIDLATRDLSQIQKSYFDFSELVNRFPNSRYTPAAYQYMVYLRNIMADNELHVSEYYYQSQSLCCRSKSRE